MQERDEGFVIGLEEGGVGHHHLLQPVAEGSCIVDFGLHMGTQAAEEIDDDLVVDHLLGREIMVDGGLRNADRLGDILQGSTLKAFFRKQLGGLCENGFARRRNGCRTSEGAFPGFFHLIRSLRLTGADPVSYYRPAGQ
ncbi:hypothetical protein D3C87_1702100 [compost metagenome]